MPFLELDGVGIAVGTGGQLSYLLSAGVQDLEDRALKGEMVISVRDIRSGGFLLNPKITVGGFRRLSRGLCRHGRFIGKLEDTALLLITASKRVLLQHGERHVIYAVFRMLLKQLQGKVLVRRFAFPLAAGMRTPDLHLAVVVVS